MDFAFSDDQDQLRLAVRGLLGQRLPDARVHELADLPPATSTPAMADPDLWAQIAGLGWLTMSGPGGGTFLDDAVLLEECGYALAPLPITSTLIASPALTASGSDPTRPAAVAWAEPGSPAFGTAAGLRCAATTDPADAAGCRLTGTKTDVADLAAADHIIVVASGGHGDQRPDPGTVVVAGVAAASSGVGVHELDTIDGTRRVGRLDLDDAPGRVIADPGGSAALLTAIRRRALAAVALEAVGVGQRALDIAAAHACSREQFGRPIGTYQGVSHQIADIYVGTQLARSLAYRAAWYVATAETEPDQVDPATVDSACSAAKAAAAQAAVDACETAIQVLGGIGMTWEHLIHRFYKRALADHGYAGTPAHHRAAVAAALLDT